MAEREVITSDKLKGIELPYPECGRAMRSTGRMHYDAGVFTWFVEFECPMDDEFGISGPSLEKLAQAILREQE